MTAFDPAASRAVTGRQRCVRTFQPMTVLFIAIRALYKQFLVPQWSLSMQTDHLGGFLILCFLCDQRFHHRKIMRCRAALLSLLAALCAVQSSIAAISIDLGARNWWMTNGNGSIALKTRVPAYALEVVRAAGIISDPLYRYGERESRWVALDRWTFSTSWSGSDFKGWKGMKEVVLSFDGIDTLANITLNGQLLATVDSYYRKYAFPVKKLLVAGNNTLTVSITPAIPTAVERKQKHPYAIPTVTQLGNVDAFNFMRKPGYDFGWDWGPAFAASGIQGGVKLTGYNTAVLEGVHLHQHPTAGDFLLKVEAELYTPPGGDSGVLTVVLPKLGVQHQQQLQLKAGQSFKTFNLTIKEEAIKLWWPIGMGKQHLYDAVVTYTPDVVLKGTASATRKLAGADKSAPAVAACSSQGDSEGPACSSITRRIGFRRVKLVQKPLEEAAKNLLGAAGGWENTTPVKTGFQWCKGTGRCGQWGLVNSTKWSFVSATDWAPWTNKDAKYTGYPFGPYPGGEQPWWADDALGVYISPNGNPENAKFIEGESFYFEVNGVPLYAKGANIIPFNVISTNVTTDEVKKVMDMAISSKMNMLRVWGGGWYNMDWFYDYADATGLLIWQETMFACNPYPRNDEFVENVRIEVEQQIRRINGHPSVVIWGGNNEIETSLDWYRTTDSNRALYAHDYVVLFIETIGKALEQLAPGAAFVDSSPSNGLISHKPYIKRWGNAQDSRYGDVHYYDYYSDCQDVTTYPQAKFVSEHGWPSFPTWSTWAEATAPEDSGVGVKGMEFRQRHFNKTMEMINQYSYHFNVPRWLDMTPNQNEKDRIASFKQYLYFNHVQQALCIGTAAGYWRRLRSSPQALTMGLLYWQLNDVWAGASWSGMDYRLRWKPMQYAVNRQFQDFVVQAQNDNSNVTVYVVSDLMQPTKAELEVAVYPLKANSCGSDNGPALYTSRTAVAVPALNAAAVWAMPLNSLLSQAPGCNPNSCYVSIKAKAAAPAAALPGQAGYKTDLTSHTSLFFAQFKQLSLSEPQVDVKDFKQVDDKTVSFVVSTGAAAAPLTVLDTDVVGQFSDNLLDLAPCESRKLTFTSIEGPVNGKALSQGLQVQTLFKNQGS